MNSELQQLCHYCKVDFKAYEKDIEAQLQLLESLLQLTLANSASRTEQISSLLIFVTSIANSVAQFQVTQQILQDVVQILQRHGEVLDPGLRFQLVRTLATLSKSSAYDISNLLPCYFQLFHCSDKQLRKYLFQVTIKAVEREMKGGSKLGSQCKSVLYQYLQDSHEKVAQKTLLLLVRLYAEGILSDASTCNVMSSCCFHENTKMKAIAIHFFLQERFEEDDDSDSSYSSSDEEEKHLNEVHAVVSQKTRELWNNYKLTSKKNLRKRRQLERKISRICKSERRRRRKHQLDPKVEPPVSLLFQPEEFAEKLFVELKKKNQRFQLRLAIIQLIARVVGFHLLDIPPFIHYLLKYLRPHQEGVTKILVILLQAIHEYTPLETIEMVIRYIADHFVIPQMSADTCAVGLNSIRLLCEKQPNAIDTALLEDLIQYKTSKDKSVMMAARSLLSVYRKLCPGLLAKSERGKLGNIRAMKEKRALASESSSLIAVSSEEDDETCSQSWDSSDSCYEESDSSLETDSFIEETNSQYSTQDNAYDSNLFTQRILSDNDFVRLKQLGMGTIAIDENALKAISVADIETFQTKRRRSKEERIAAVKQGRNDRQKYGKGSKQKFKTGPTTNRAKQKRQVTGIIQQRRRKQFMQSLKQRTKRRK
ncbi:Protein SDA1 [Galdieria sulphuraria]|uniref:Protein SDA1 n=1 Tax=Galdieria sulphuraria TaxID=130081 RepID=M2W213_GALSU|nr:SDA1 family protein [Galdieria sulphuraria]EME29726.1 SDA1 family protein [Galdieria sulphuraria]GJD07981.1 Protein SDA1 [Galdieria sulphuraria]|eukprot:XP_005706246.1 SDA1 family protein [Galdieria sulphuraria]